jgi:hypothetical protein
MGPLGLYQNVNDMSLFTQNLDLAGSASAKTLLLEGWLYIASDRLGVGGLSQWVDGRRSGRANGEACLRQHCPDCLFAMK